MHDYSNIAARLREAQRIAVFTGAGISTASGIPDFRSRGGLYDTELPVEALLSETYYRMKPKLFWHHFKSIFRLREMSDSKPNDGHLFLRGLELAGKDVRILTQNVDGLHRKAGNEHVYELHGTVGIAFCPKCGAVYGIDHVLEEEVPRCAKDDWILKPDVVLFEGAVKHLEEAFKLAGEAEVMLVMGSSLEVYPVRELPAYAKKAYKLIINRDPTRMDGIFDEVVHEDIVEAVRGIMKLFPLPYEAPKG